MPTRTQVPLPRFESTYAGDPTDQNPAALRRKVTILDAIRWTATPIDKVQLKITRAIQHLKMIIISPRLAKPSKSISLVRLA